MIQFDHIEVHVTDSYSYVKFLEKLFGGGRYKKIALNNTFMFLSPENMRIEVKENDNFKLRFSVDQGIGFCLPCLRMKNAKFHIETLREITITKTIINPDGECIFFKDYEGIDWHIKDYENLDIFTNI